MGILYYLILGALIIFVIMTLCIVKIKENERGVKFKAGKFNCIMEPGIHIVIPILEHYDVVDINTKTYPLLQNEFITKDNIKVKVDTHFTFNIYDPEKAVLNVHHYYIALFNLVEITMRNVIGTLDYKELLYRKERTENSVFEIVRTASEEFGIKIEKLEIREIQKTKD